MNAAQPAQQRLADAHARRLALMEDGARRLEALAAAPPAGNPAAALGAPASEVAAYVVMSRFSPQVFMQSVPGFVSTLPAPWAAAWLRSFTKTIYLLGNPENLRRRFRFQYVSPDGTMGWLCPASAEEASTLQRLLVLFGNHPLDVPEDFDIRVGDAHLPPGAAYTLQISTVDSSAAKYHVDLHHVLAEALLGGLVHAGDTLRIRHVPVLHCTAARYLYLRVTPDPRQPGEFNAHAGLSACTSN